MDKQKRKAFNEFNKMKQGQVIIIKDFAKRDSAAFTDYGKEYIDQGGNIEFSNDYSKIRKISAIEEYKPINELKSKI